ncbi:MAG: insulinase family protein [Thermoguttaceae bacterium]|nr:insulinase family protein [Thermoguttaceae bacterium]MDW8038664.1 pitrilysin family protein [Thermoguttaceae bacterium]
MIRDVRGQTGDVFRLCVQGMVLLVISSGIWVCAAQWTAITGLAVPLVGPPTNIPTASESPPMAEAKPPAGEKPGAAPPPTLSVVHRRQLPDAVTLATLSNGLTVIIQENHVAPVATVRCFVKNTGSAFEGQYLGSGISHLVEHIVAGGSTTRRTEAQIRELIDRFGGATNAMTSQDMTMYYIDCPAKDIETAIELLADWMQHARFDPAECQREHAVVRQELADGLVQRNRVLWELFEQTMYQVHPVRHPTIGYLDSLNRLSREDLLHFYRTRYVPNNQVFVVVGDVDTEKVLAAVIRHWAGTGRGPETVIPIPTEPPQLTPREAVREMEGKMVDMILAWPTVELTHPDLFALDVAAAILGEGDSSRLVRLLKHERGWVLSIRTASYTPPFVRGWFGVIATAPPEHWQQAADEILRQVYRLRDEPVSAPELEKAKKQKAAELVLDQQTVQDAADSLGRSFLATGDPLFDKHYVAGIQKVTAGQVQEAARKYFVPERLNRVCVLPPGIGGQASVQAKTAQETPIRLLRLSNGLRVLLKRQPHKPMVNIQAAVLGGSLEDNPETAGRSSLVAAMLDKGTARMSAAQIAEFFDRIGGRFSAIGGRNTILASLSVLREDFPEAAAVFADCFLHPAFPEDQFAVVQKLALASIARRTDNPQQELMELFHASLPTSSPYHIMPGGTMEAVGRLRPEDLRAYHRRYFVPSNMVVSVFGDIEPEQAQEIITRHFGQLPAAAPPKIDFRRPNSLEQPIIRHKQTAKQTGMVLLAYPAPSLFEEKEFAALTVLDAILSGYSYPGGWLHEDLRGAGLVYMVHAFLMSGPAPGYFVIIAQTAPDKIQEVLSRIRTHLERARRGEIPEAEFQRAVEMIIALHSQENTTPAEQAQQAAIYELFGLGYDYEQKFPERIRSVRREDVTAVAQKMFERFVQITTSPLAEPKPK